MFIRLLALDSSMEMCSVSLLNYQEVESRFEIANQDHEKRILPLVNKVLNLHKLSINDLNGVVFSKGPGSFTGIRIGVSVAQGIAVAASIPMISISTFKVLAEGVWRQYGAIRVLIAIDAKIDGYYFAEYVRTKEGDWDGKITKNIFSFEEIFQQIHILQGEWFTVGKIWKKMIPLLKGKSGLFLKFSEVFFPSAEDMFPLAKKAWLNGDTILPEDVNISYLQNETLWKKNRCSL